MNAWHRLVAFATFAVMTGAYALDGVWTNQTTTDAQSWKDVASWTDADGNPLETYPSAATDTATLSPIVAFENQVIFLPWSDFVLGAVAGGYPQTVQLGADKAGRTVSYFNSNSTDYNVADKVIDVRSWKDFKGYVEPIHGSMTLKLPTADSDGRGMWSFAAYALAALDVASDGAQGVVENIYRTGAVKKTGSGELVVKSADSGNNVFYVQKGTLTLDGGSDAEMERLMARAALHFDASVTNTIVHAVAADGLDTVTRWDDVRQNGLMATPNTYAGSVPFLTFSRAPFLSAHRSPTGLSFVDFGARQCDGADVAELGPTNCSMVLSKGFSGVREVFCAAYFPRDMRNVTVLGDKNQYHLIPDGTWDRFVQYAGGDVAYARCRNGDLSLNGEKVSDSTKPSTVTGMNVYSISPLAGLNVSMIGTGCNRGEATGGCRIGEVLAFTNELTRAERTRLNRYLLRKWRGEDDGRMAKSVFAANDATVKVGVPSGSRAHVGEIVAAGASVTKTGGGELVVDRVVPKTAKITVAEGSVSFGNVPVPTKKVAEDPYIWLDAQTIDQGGVMRFDGDSQTYVHSWRDCRADVDRAAVGIYIEPPRMAYLLKDAVGPGKDAVSFGSRALGNHSHMKFPNWNAGVAYAGFAVVRLNDLVYNNQQAIFGSSMLDTARDQKHLMHKFYWRPVSDSARWAINGEPADPHADQTLLNQTNEFLLVSFTSDTAINIGGIACTRTTDTTGPYPNDCGGCEIAEMIVYDRRITEEERRETEAYLLDRWLDKAHPASSATRAAAVIYASGVDPVLGADGDASLPSVSAEGGTLTKRGAGTLTLDDAKGVLAIDVAEGSLVVNPPSPDSFGPNLHFDAMRTDSLTTSVSSDGTLTNVTSWASTAGGLVAKSRAADSTVAGGYLKHPTLQTVATPSGDRSVVDFGKFVLDTKKSADMNAAAMSFSRIFAAEAHVVLADKNGGTERQCVLISSSDFSWLRGQNGAIFDNLYKNTKADTRNGYIAINGVKGDADSKLPTGLDLVSLAPLSNRPIDWICNDRAYSYGGLQVGEEIAYATALTDVQRAYVQDYLQWKWRGGARPVWTNAYDSICVAAGSSLSLAQCVVRTPSVSGGGTIAADLADVAEISLDWTESADRHLSVNGAVAFASTVTVRIVAGKKLPYGDHVVLSASSISGFDTSTWLEVTDAQVRGSVLFVRDGNDILLRHNRPGLSVIVK